MSEARRTSEAVQATYRKLSKRMKGYKPSEKAFAGSMATRALKRIGLNRREQPRLWRAYQELYLRRRTAA